MLALSPRLPVGKVGVGTRKKGPSAGPCQPPVLEGKTCALGTRSSRSPRGPRSAGSEGRGQRQHLACLSRAGSAEPLLDLDPLGKGGGHIQTGTAINLLVTRVAPATAPPTRPLRRVPSPAAFQVGQLGKERGGEKMTGAHILDEEDSPTAVNSVGPPAGQVQPVNLIGHLGVPQPLRLPAHRGVGPGGGRGGATASPPLLLLLEAATGARVQAAVRPAPWPGAPASRWRQLAASRAAGSGRLNPGGAERARPQTRAAPGAGAPLPPSPELNDGQLARRGSAAPLARAARGQRRGLGPVCSPRPGGRRGRAGERASRRTLPGGRGAPGAGEGAAARLPARTRPPPGERRAGPRAAPGAAPGRRGPPRPAGPESRLPARGAPAWRTEMGVLTRRGTSSL